MGTHGAFGFRVNDKDSITYNHWDSYPSGLGNKIANFLSEFSDVEAIKEIAENLVLVDADSKPTEDQKAEAKELGLYNDGVSTGSDDEWYCLLRNSQGDISVYAKGLKYMIDNHGFLEDSLFCEWAYIMNLDTGRLEIYCGFNKDKDAYGRYASSQKSSMNGRADGYYGVALYKWIPLENFFGQAIDLEYIEKEVYAEEE